MQGTMDAQKSESLMERWMPGSRNASLAVALAVLALIGWVDRHSGWEISLFVIYAVPILLVVWRAETWTAITFVLLCTVVWWGVNASELPYQTSFGYVLAAFSRFVYFAFVAFGGLAMKAHVDADRARIAALERARSLEGEIVRASEYEQRRIGQDLHDGLCQELAAVGCAARSLADDLESRLPAAAAEALEIESMIKRAVVHTRDLARGIFPVQMDAAGLAVALGELAASMRKSGDIDLEFHDSGDVNIDDPEVAMNLYRIAQEAVRNSIKHSGASKITVSLDNDNDPRTVRLTVVDNGYGISAEDQHGSGMGLRTMQHRAAAMGANLEFANGEGGGAIVSCVLRKEKEP